MNNSVIQFPIYNYYSIMNTKRNIGQQFVNQMLCQITQFRHLANKNSRITSENRRYVSSKQKPKSSSTMRTQRNKTTPKSGDQFRRSSNSMIRQSSTEKRLKLYQKKVINQLKNPFSKIHVRRPFSANLTGQNHLQQTNYSPRKELQNERYQQIKKYYETKYVNSNKTQVLSRRKHSENMVYSEYLNNQIKEQPQLTNFCKEIQIDRPVSCRRSYYLQKKNN